MPTNSVEYLCAYDLLEMIIAEFAGKDSVLPPELFAIDLPVPPVITAEIAGSYDYADLPLPTVGAVLHRYWQINWGDD